MNKVLFYFGLFVYYLVFIFVKFISIYFLGLLVKSIDYFEINLEKFWVKGN